MVCVDPADPNDLTAFTRWYDDVQIPGFLKIAGTRRVIRYRAMAAGPAPQNFLVTYELAFPAPEGLPAYAEAQHQATRDKKIGRHSPGGSALKVETAAGAYYKLIAQAGAPNVVPASVIVMYTDPPPGLEDHTLMRWYVDEHLSAAVKLQGVKAAKFYRFTEINKDRMPTRWIVPHRFLTIYELEVHSETALAVAAGALKATVRARGAAAVDVGRIALQAYTRVSEPRGPE